jgi:hypothetical protein
VKRNPALPPAFVALVMRLLSKKPADRPKNTREVAAALEAIADELSPNKRPTKSRKRALDKSSLTQSDLICIKQADKKGRGVFATRPIKKGAIIETVPVVFVPIRDLVDGAENPTFKKYLYHWTDTHVAICLGYGLLYNHSFKPNAVYTHGKDTLTYKALRDIAKAEEITINYNFDPKDQTPVDFEVS